MTYLRPLRDADRSLSAGRNSRLAQVLGSTASIETDGASFSPGCDLNTLDLAALSVLGIGDLANELLKNQKAVVGARGTIDEHLGSLAIGDDPLKAKIIVSGATSSAQLRLRQLLEKLDLALGGEGRLGLGSNNLLFMACELLLLAQDDDGNRLLLIEEPEAHLHAQRQLRVMRSLQQETIRNRLQIIVTTHSPNLASAIDLNNLVIIRGGRAFPLAEGQTELTAGDYRFLSRFLDVTKANLFFACGVLIVEGDAENILLPTLASLIGRDFTKYGVSVVNVGGVGLRRYAKIFQRKHVTSGQLEIPVACMSDLDVMPNCAPEIVQRVRPGEPWPAIASPRWRARKDFTTEKLNDFRENKAAKPSGQCVRTFVADGWTFEYDLALGPRGADDQFVGGFAEDVFVATVLAAHEEKLATGNKSADDLAAAAVDDFKLISKFCKPTENCTTEEVVASTVYARFEVDNVSKAIAAQYLAERLRKQVADKIRDGDDIRRRLPKYIVEAIDYVTGGSLAPPQPPTPKTT